MCVCVCVGVGVCCGSAPIILFSIISDTPRFCQYTAFPEQGARDEPPGHARCAAVVFQREDLLKGAWCVKLCIMSAEGGEVK